MHLLWGAAVTECMAQLLPNNTLRQTSSDIPLLISLLAGQSLASLGWDQLDVVVCHYLQE